MILLEISEHAGELQTEGIQLRFAARPHSTASSPHQRIKVRGEGHTVEPALTLGVQALAPHGASTEQLVGGLT